MKSIALTSGKGGTGKSCVAAYTGAAFAAQGHKTLLLELGDTFRSLDLITGVLEKAVFDIGDVIAGRCEPGKAIVQTGYHPNLYLLPAGIEPMAPVSSAQLRELLRTLENEFAYVLIDGINFSAVSPGLVDVILQVLTPDTLCIRACTQQANLLTEQGARQLRLVINNVPAKVPPMYGLKDFDDVIDQVGVQLIAVIPASPKLQHSANNAGKLDSESITVKVFDNLASRLQGKRLPLLIR